MKVGIDMRMASRHLGGMAVYLKNLVNQLPKIDKENNYLLLHDRQLTGWGWWQKLQWIVGEHFWVQYKLPIIFKQKGIDLGFFPNPPVPFLPTIPIVLTIPDMAFVYDTGIPSWIKVYLWSIYFLSAHKATRILTFSNNSKRDINKILKVSLEKVYVQPLAAPDSIHAVPSRYLKQAQKKFALTKPYILSVPGTFLPRKNISDLLLAFKDTTSKYRRNYQLVIVGITTGKNFMAVKQQIQKLRLQSQVVFTGRLPDSELAALYTGATLFVCTSLYEGFGLPILEAMKCGAPVIAYANSSLPEVVGNAGILVNNHTELSKAMQQVLDSRVLQNTLKRKGLERAAMYSWAKTASTFLASLPKNVN